MKGTSLISLFLFLRVCVAGCDATLPKERQNVLLIVADDLRAEIDAAGFACTSVRCHTPNLNAFSEKRDTIVFAKAYVQQALCAPSRNSFLTGRRPDATKSWNFIDHFRETGVGSNWTTLPQAFKRAGYAVFGTGKIFHPHLPPNWDLPLSWDRRMSSGEWQGWMYPSEPRCADENVGCTVGSPNGSPEDDAVSDFDDLQVTQRALALMKNLTESGDVPWFLAVGYRKPHVQWRVPARCLQHISAESVRMPKHRTFPESAPDIAFHQPINDFLEPFADVRSCGGESAMSPNVSFPDACVLRWRRYYHASVTFLDEQVGRLLSALDAARHNAAKRTVVVFVSDHGWQLGEWAEWEKFTNFELSARVPLIFHAPGQLRTRRSVVDSETLVELIDVMPTLFELAMPDARENMSDLFHVLNGKSLASRFWEAGAPSRRIDEHAEQFALTQFPRCVQPGLPAWRRNDCDDVPRENFTHMGLSIRTPRWRLTRWLLWNGTSLSPIWDDASDGGVVELYDHAGDDGMSTDADYEARSVARDFPEVVARLTDLLREKFRSEGARVIGT
eukprot:g748.t1